MRTTILIFVITVLSFTNVFAQSSPGDIVTDRPDQTESPDLVPPGYVQIEGGISYNKLSYDTKSYIRSIITEKNMSIPLLIRIGVFQSFEFRISGEYSYTKTKLDYPDGNVEVISGGSFVVSGYPPLVLGTKLKIVDESEYIPNSAFLFHVDLPQVATGAFNSDYPTPEFRVALSKTLSETFSLGLNLGAEFNTLYRKTNGIYTLALGAGLTEKIGSFIEFYGFFEKGFNRHYLDGGLTYLFLPNVQFDVSGGVGLNENATDFFIGGGLAMRLPR